MTYWATLLNYLTQRDRAWVLSLLAASAIVYLPFLANPFIFDDLNFFSTGLVESYSGQWREFGLRWVPYASLGWIYATFSAELPHVYHVASMLLHVANAILLFYFLRALICAVQPDNGNSHAIVRGAWFGAMVYAIHPVAVFAVGYVIQISILMATLFSLLMQLAYLRGMLSGQKRWFVLATGAYFLACFSKEHSVLMPIVVGAMSYLVYSENRARRWVMLLTWAAFFLIAVLVTLRAKGVLGNPYEAMATELFVQQGIVASTPLLHLLSALTQAGLFFKYLLLWLLPEPALMSVDMREPFIASLVAWQAWLGGAAFLLYGAVAFRLLMYKGMKGLFGFAFLYPWLLFLVEMTGIRVQEIFVLYRSYLWMPGMMLLIPLLTINYSIRRTVLVFIGAVILLIPLSWVRLWVFADNYRIWNEAAILLENDQVAGTDRILYNRGLAELDRGKWEAAASDFNRAAAISPQLAPVRYYLGLSYTNMGRFDEALAQYDLAISIMPNDGRVYYAKGITLKGLHKDDEAMLQMEHACKLKDQMACIIVAMGKGKR